MLFSGAHRHTHRYGPQHWKEWIVHDEDTQKKREKRSRLMMGRERIRLSSNVRWVGESRQKFYRYLVRAVGRRFFRQIRSTDVSPMKFSLVCCSIFDSTQTGERRGGVRLRGRVIWFVEFYSSSSTANLRKDAGRSTVLSAIRTILWPNRTGNHYYYQRNELFFGHRNGQLFYLALTSTRIEIGWHTDDGVNRKWN